MLRQGQLALFLCYLALLGGQFSLDRVLAGAPAADLRWAGLAVAGMFTLLWLTVAPAPTKSTRVGPGALWFTGWAGWMALSSEWAPTNARTADYLLDMFFLVALTSLTWAIARRLPREALAAIIPWVWWTGLVYLAGALAAGPDAQGRFSAFGGGSNVFVRVMLLAALAALYLAAKSERRLYLWSLPLLLAGAVLSGSRGGLVAFAAVCLVGAWPILRSMPRGTASRLVVIGAAVMFVVQASVGAAVRTVFQERFVLQTALGRYDSGRGDLFEQSLDLWDRHFWFGAGLDGYYGLIGQMVGYEYPHNLILASAAEGGLVAVVLLGLAWFAFGMSWRRERPRSLEVLFYRNAALFILVASMFSGSYYDSRLMWLFLGLAALEGRRGARTGSVRRGHRPAPQCSP